VNEYSTTTLPGANTHRPHVECGVEAMTVEQEARRANEEAAKQSTAPKKDH